MKEILVVDDSPVVRKVACRLLEHLHLRVFEAEDGRTGLSACEKRMPDAILVDLQMPEMDAVAFLSTLRQMPEGSKPKVVFLTAEHDVGHIARALHVGADSYLMKPFDQTIIRAKFEEIGLV